MLISELITKLEKAKENFGDVEVLVESKDNVEITNVFVITENLTEGLFCHVRLTDADEEWVKDVCTQCSVDENLVFKIEKI